MTRARLVEPAGGGAGVIVRGAEPRDLDAVLSLLLKDPFTAGLAADELRPLFDYGWAATRHNLGWVLVDADRIVGFAAAVYSERRAGNRTDEVCNGSLLYVEPEYRSARTAGSAPGAARLVLAPTVLPSTTVTVFTARGPRLAVQKLLPRVGWETIGRVRLVYPRPLLASVPLLRRVALLHQPAELADLLDEEHLRYMHDHVPYGCGFHLVTADGARCFVVTKRRQLRGAQLWPRLTFSRLARRRFAVSDLLYISSPEVAFRRWSHVVAGICAQQRTWALTSHDVVLGGQAPRTHGHAAPVYALNRRIDLARVDALYSEYVLVPA